MGSIVSNHTKNRYILSDERQKEKPCLAEPVCQIWQAEEGTRSNGFAGLSNEDFQKDLKNYKKDKCRNKSLLTSVARNSLRQGGSCTPLPFRLLPSLELLAGAALLKLASPKAPLCIYDHPVFSSRAGICSRSRFQRPIPFPERVAAFAPNKTDLRSQVGFDLA